MMAHCEGSTTLDDLNVIHLILKYGALPYHHKRSKFHETTFERWHYKSFMKEHGRDFIKLQCSTINQEVKVPKMPEMTVNKLHQQAKGRTIKVEQVSTRPAVLDVDEIPTLWKIQQTIFDASVVTLKFATATRAALRRPLPNKSVSLAFKILWN